MVREPDIDGSTDGQDGATGRRTFLAGAGTLAAGVVAGGTAAGADGPATTATVTFDGIEHRLLGDATAEVLDGSLVVSGFGDSGDDGVAALLGQAVGWRADIDGTVGQLPEGGALSSTAVGNVEGEPGLVATSVTTTREGDALAVDWDYPIANDNLAVEVHDGASLVVREPVNNTDSITIHPPDAYDHNYFESTDDDEPLLATLSPTGPPDPACVTEYSSSDGSEFQVQIGGSEYAGTRVGVLEDPSEETYDIWYTSEYRLTGAGIDELVVDAEGLTRGVMFDHLANRRVGDATLTRTADSLDVADTDDADGVRVEVGSVTSVAVSFDGVSLTNTGERLDDEVVGVVDGTAGTTVATAGLDNVGMALEVLAAFDALGTDTVTVTVLEGGSVSGSVVTSDGSVAMVGGEPGVVETAATRGDPPGVGFRFEQSTMVMAGGEVFQGDEVRVAANDPAASVDALQDLVLTGTGLDGVGILDEQPVV